MDLSLISTDELWDELRKRFDCAVLLTKKDVNPDEYAPHIRWSGGGTDAVGLCAFAHQFIVDDILHRPNRFTDDGSEDSD